MSTSRKRTPIHPGEVLLEDFMMPMCISASHLAEGSGLALDEIEALVDESADISGRAANALGHFFGVDPQWWINMQERFDRGRVGQN